MNDDTYEAYLNDSDFKRYVDEYCSHRNLGIFEAIGHKVVKGTAEYYRTAKKDIIETQNGIPGCDDR